MSKYILLRIVHEPITLIKRVLYKIFIGPLKYRSADGYAAQRYWHDRFLKHKNELKSTGVEGYSEAENKQLYADSQKEFQEIFKNLNLNLPSLTVLSVGVGLGFDTQFFHSQGVKEYTGLDITDILFPALQKQFLNYKFIQRDITSEQITEKFNLIVMIDVIEHIVSEDKLASAFKHIRDCLLEDGTLLLSPIKQKRKKRAFYLQSWTIDDIKKYFLGYELSEPLKFRRDHLLIIRKSSRNN